MSSAKRYGIFGHGSDGSVGYFRSAEHEHGEWVRASDYDALHVQLNAWHEVFGTTQLSHAKAEFDALKQENEGSHIILTDAGIERSRCDDDDMLRQIGLPSRISLLWAKLEEQIETLKRTLAEREGEIERLKNALLYMNGWLCREIDGHMHASAAYARGVVLEALDTPTPPSEVKGE